MSNIQQGDDDLILQIEQTRRDVLQQIHQWRQRQNDVVHLNTRTPVDLYSTVYEGAPKRYLSGILIAGISPNSIKDWIPNLKGSKILSHFKNWFSMYEQYPLQIDPNQVLLVTDTGVRFNNHSMEFNSMRVGDLIQVHRFFNDICSDLPDLVKHLENINRNDNSQSPSYFRRLINRRRLLSFEPATRTTHSQ